jgi:hypothetical protein
MAQNNNTLSLPFENTLAESDIPPYKTDSGFVTLTFHQNNKFTLEFTAAFKKFLNAHFPKDKLLLEFQDTNCHQNYVIRLTITDLKYLNHLTNLKSSFKGVLACKQK